MQRANNLIIEERTLAQSETKVRTLIRNAVVYSVNLSNENGIFFLRSDLDFNLLTILKSGRNNLLIVFIRVVGLSGAITSNTNTDQTHETNFGIHVELVEELPGELGSG